MTPQQISDLGLHQPASAPAAESSAPMPIGGAGGSPATADTGTAAILSGDKTATSSVLWDYPDELPFVGA